MKFKVFGSVSVILGAIIGAGFASGREIVTFFAEYGFISILFLIPLFFVMNLAIKTFLKVGQGRYSVDYGSKKTVNYLYLITFTVFSSGMIAGIDELFNELIFSTNIHLWGFIAIIVCAFCVMKGFKLLVKLNMIIMSFIVIAVFAICILSFGYGEQSPAVFSSDISNIFFLISSVWLYSGVNLIVASGVIKKVGKELDKKQIKKVAIITSLIIVAFIVLITCSLLINNNAYIFVQMPLLELAFSINNALGYAFSIVIFFSIFTTLLTTIFSLSGTLKENYNFKINSIVLACLISFVLSFFGFENIIKYLYPIIGTFGVYVFYCDYVYLKLFSESPISRFNKADNKIHSACKETKNNSTSHHKV